MGPELTVLLKKPLETNRLIDGSWRILQRSLAYSDLPTFTVFELRFGKEVAPSAFFWNNYFILRLNSTPVSEVHLIGAELKPDWEEIPRHELGSHVAIATPRRASVLERAVAAAVAIAMAKQGTFKVEDDGCNWIDEECMDPDVFFERMTVPHESPDLKFALEQFLALLPEQVRESCPPLISLD